jgi:sensor histidine kinase YesM
MSSKNSENLRSYMYNSRILGERILDLDHSTYTDESTLIERNIASLLKDFIVAGDAAVQAKRARNTREYDFHHNRFRELGAQIQERSNALRLFLLDDQVNTLAAFSSGMTRVRRFNMATIGSAFLFGFILIFYYTKKISTPIFRLGQEANKIAQGIFDETVLPLEGEDEVSITSHAFNIMKSSIQESISAIQNKANIENALLQERMKNLEMSGLLQKSELEALQARINPHFLFNSLNTGLQLAVVEDADKTRQFLEQLAQLMRYSFRETEQSAALLSEEIEYIRSYMYLMTIRFPGVFSIDISMDFDAKKALFPKMIIQPLVENAISHGLYQKTEDACLKIHGFLDENMIVLCVEDNGIGITEERKAEIFDAADKKKDQISSGNPISYGNQISGGNHGHGLVNVIWRLRLFSGLSDVFFIEPLEPSGTRIRIRIPFQEAS